WDNLYTNELSNHAHDPADTGTNWFEDSDAQEKVLEFLSDFLPAEGGQETTTAKTRTSFLDLGTGNGDMLFGLRDAGWTGPMLGVDYSERSVEFARRIEDARRKGLTPRHTFDSDDERHSGHRLPNPRHPHPVPAPRRPVPHGGQGWDVVLDKGTFDAISLSSETDPTTGRRVSESYRARVLPLVREGGLFLVTSCNWTEDELHKWFAGEQQQGQEQEQGAEAEEERRWRFQQVGRVEYPSFSFGGVKGSTISSVCFRKTARAS
ncbi:Protein-lysine N-methyltransferase EFM4, partial [Apiospora kogelbergensis]|uniref:Protein-lysine N-methyltransferase EFM4 n=1 Tax=Apiospora kogelbergensis TaxID=1337665 RepID=UPI00312DB83A